MVLGFVDPETIGKRAFDRFLLFLFSRHSAPKGLDVEVLVEFQVAGTDGHFEESAIVHATRADEVIQFHAPGSHTVVNFRGMERYRKGFDDQAGLVELTVEVVQAVVAPFVVDKRHIHRACLNVVGLRIEVISTEHPPAPLADPADLVTLAVGEVGTEKSRIVGITLSERVGQIGSAPYSSLDTRGTDGCFFRRGNIPHHVFEREEEALVRMRLCSKCGWSDRSEKLHVADALSGAWQGYPRQND